MSLTCIYEESLKDINGHALTYTFGDCRAIIYPILWGKFAKKKSVYAPQLAAGYLIVSISEICSGS